MTLANCPGAAPRRESAHRPGINPCPSTQDQDEEPTGSQVPRDRSGAGALRAGLHNVEPECAVVVDVYQDAKPAGNSRSVDPEGVVALRAGVRAIEDLAPAGIGDPARAGAPVAKYLAARDGQRRAEVPDAGDPRQYAVPAEPVLKPGHVTYMRPAIVRLWPTRWRNLLPAATRRMILSLPYSVNS